MAISQDVLQSLASDSFLTQHDLHILWKYGGVILHKYTKKDVMARKAITGEKITTLIKGQVETTNIASEGDIVIKNASGEEYIISEKTFSKQYSSKPLTESYQKSKSIGFRFGFVYTGPNTKLKASWGELQVLNTGDIVACMDKKGANGDIYRIAKEVLKDYKRIS